MALKVTSFLFFIYFIFLSISFAYTIEALEEKLRDEEIKINGSGDLNILMEKYKELMMQLDSSIIESSEKGFLPALSSRIADTPEREIQRRREIINSQYKAIKLKEGKNLEEVQEDFYPVKAIPIEGYIILEGGEKVFWYNNQVKQEIKYLIKEQFVGNLIFLEKLNNQTNNLAQQRQYLLDTLSTDIKILNQAGKICTKWSYYIPSYCEKYSNFILYEIDKSEFYPNFSSGVVKLSSMENNEIEIEANTPNITFYAKDGLNRIPAQIGCTSGKWRLSMGEFEKLLKLGSFTLKKEIGYISPVASSCIPGSTMTLYVRVKKEEPQKCNEQKNVQINIIKPVQNSRYIFTDEGNTGSLIIELEAKVNPAEYKNSVEWEIPEMEGSNIEIKPFSSSKPKGEKVEVIYKGLPYALGSFGRQRVKAHINVNGCNVEDTKEILIFYPRDAKNNPEGKYYNWFYYWKQSPAAKPFGQNVKIEFGGTEYDLCQGSHTMAIYKPEDLFKAIYICDLTKKVGGKFEVTIPHVSRHVPETLQRKKLITYTHIDTFAVLVMHEFTHFNNFHTWWFGKSMEERERQDRDYDGIPDRLENEMGFDPNNFQTFWGDDEDFKNINGDEEFIAYESTYDYPIGKFDNYDWGKPGKNWD